MTTGGPRLALPPDLLAAEAERSRSRRAGRRGRTVFGSSGIFAVCITTDSFARPRRQGLTRGVENRTLVCSRLHGCRSEAVKQIRSPRGHGGCTGLVGVAGRRQAVRFAECAAGIAEDPKLPYSAPSGNSGTGSSSTDGENCDNDPTKVVLFEIAPSSPFAHQSPQTSGFLAMALREASEVLGKGSGNVDVYPFGFQLGRLHATAGSTATSRDRRV